MTEPSGEIDINRLLTIDVGAELRKLMEAQLQGPWQLPAELVRRALRRGATRVDVEFGRHSLTVRDNGRDADPDALEPFACLLDTARPSDERHGALLTLEKTGSLALLGLVGLEPQGLRISLVEGSRGRVLEWISGARPKLRALASPMPEHNTVELRGVDLDRVRARKWLESVVRFARATIRIDRKPVVRGWADSLITRPLRTPFSGAISIPRSGEQARVWLLQDGIVTSHFTAPRLPCFEVALETRDLLPTTATGERLRAAVFHHLPALVDQVLELLLSATANGRELSREDRTRVTQLLLQAARDRERAPAVAQAPMFRGLEPDGRERWFDLLTLRSSVIEEGPERHLLALLPDQQPGDYVFSDRVFVLEEAERALLAEIFELRFRAPPVRNAAGLTYWGRLRESVGETKLWAKTSVANIFDALRPGGHVLPPEELHEPERLLLSALRAQLDHRVLGLCRGSGSIRRGPHRLVLPRDNPEVQAAIRMVASDPAWVYPAVLALLDGREFPDRARRRWGFEAWAD
jgi:hypothetical protein